MEQYIKSYHKLWVCKTNNLEVDKKLPKENLHILLQET